MDLLKEFEEYALFELGRRPSTVTAYLHRYGRLQAVIGKPIEVIAANGTDDLRELKRNVLAGKGPVQPNTLRGWIVGIHQLHLFGYIEGYWERNGVMDVKVPPVDEQALPPVSRGEARVLQGSCRRPLEFRLIFPGLFAGMRIGNSALLEGPMWKDGWLDFKNEKTRRKQRVPVHPKLAAVMWDVLASRPTDTSTLQRVKRRLEKRTGVRFVSHQLRRRFAASLYDNGNPDEVVKDLLGHKGDVTRLYAPVSDQRKLDAIAGGIDY